MGMIMITMLRWTLFWFKKKLDYQAVDHDAGKEAKPGWGTQPCHRRLSRGGEITFISKMFKQSWFPA